ncbi:MAG TPA: Imm5 family immunity protein [Terriglobales bacterium]|nr:Imm5 family immunity protein [Terriglobales bacterium]
MTMQEMIDKGLSLVQHDEQHDLKVGFRCRLLSSFDSISEAGRRFRTKLAQLSVEKVLPSWESFFPTDRTPRKALELAEKVLAARISTQAAEKETRLLWAHCDDLLWRHADRQNAIMVGYGAIQAVRDSLSEKHFGCEQVTDESTDLNIEPYDSDSSCFAAVAYSGGAPWEKSSDPHKRLEFWTWWLTSAVRAAMSIA